MVNLVRHCVKKKEKNSVNEKDRDCSSVVEFLTHMHKVLSLISRILGEEMGTGREERKMRDIVLLRF